MGVSKVASFHTTLEVNRNDFTVGTGNWAAATVIGRTSRSRSRLRPTSRRCNDGGRTPADCRGGTTTPLQMNKRLGSQAGFGPFVGSGRSSASLGA